jgi:hypothetical protein
MRPHPAQEVKVARPERFELPTNWFEASYSIQLSYGRVNKCIASSYGKLKHDANLNKKVRLTFGLYDADLNQKVAPTYCLVLRLESFALMKARMSSVMSRSLVHCSL